MLSLNVNDLVFQTTGDYHLMTPWKDLVGTAEFSYRDGKNQEKTQGLGNLEGVKHGCCYR